jgi:hypothetical protein
MNTALWQDAREYIRKKREDKKRGEGAHKRRWNHGRHQARVKVYKRPESPIVVM